MSFPPQYELQVFSDNLNLFPIFLIQQCAIKFSTFIIRVQNVILEIKEDIHKKIHGQGEKTFNPKDGFFEISDHIGLGIDPDLDVINALS